MSEQLLVPELEPIDPCIVILRGRRVILDADLARIYGTTTKHLNQQVTRNRDRFPPDFMLRLQPEEKNKLVTTCDRFKNIKHSSVLPRAFTEHGAIMVASVLNSRRAVELSVLVVRAFVRFRSILAKHTELTGRLAELEKLVSSHDQSIRNIVAVLEKLVQEEAAESRPPIGFSTRRR